MNELKKALNVKLLVIGHKRHAKDTLAEIFRDKFGLTFESSSQAAANIFYMIY